MRRTTSTVLSVAVLMLLVGCNSAPERADSSAEPAADNGSVEQSTDPHEISLENLAPDFQLWPDGVTFTDSTRLIVTHARSLALQAMVERARLMHGPELSGMVNVRMIIQPDGSVSSVDLINSEWNNPYATDLTDSVLYTIEQWTFPPGLERPLALEQPFKFHP